MDYKRLKRVLSSMSELKGDLVKWERDYSDISPHLKVYLEESFRSYIIMYHELVIKYLSLCNKQQLYTNRDKKAYNTILDLHIENGDVYEELKLFLINLQIIRNRFSHEYKIPSFTEVYRFYLDNKHKFSLLYDMMLEKYKQHNDEDDNGSSKTTRQLNLFEK